METLVKILPADLTGKLHVGQADTPGIGTLEFQEFMDSHPNVIDAKFNALVDAQNANNALILPKGGTTPYTPTGDNDPATKKYVQDTLNASGSVTPEQIALINKIPEIKANADEVPEVKATAELYLYKNYGGAF